MHCAPSKEGLRNICVTAGRGARSRILHVRSQFFFGFLSSILVSGRVSEKVGHSCCYILGKFLLSFQRKKNVKVDKKGGGRLSLGGPFIC